MLNFKQINKVFKSVKRLGPIEIFAVRRRITKNCIINARTNESKMRLVQATEIITVEDMKRAHMRGYEYPRDDPKYNYKAPTFMETLKNLFK